jgi:hypothetical protein
LFLDIFTNVAANLVAGAISEAVAHCWQQAGDLMQASDAGL